MMLHRYWDSGVPEGCPADEWGDMEVVDWTFDSLDPELRDLLLSQDEFCPDDRLRHRANLVRYWMLWKYGGVWADHDVWPLESFWDWTPPRHPWCAGLRKAPVACLLGSMPGEPVWRAMIDGVVQSSLRGGAPSVSGRDLLKSMVDSSRIEKLVCIDRDASGNPVPGSMKLIRHEWVTTNEIRRLKTVG